MAMEAINTLHMAVPVFLILLNAGDGNNVLGGVPGVMT